MNVTPPSASSIREPRDCLPFKASLNLQAAHIPFVPVNYPNAKQTHMDQNTLSLAAGQPLPMANVKLRLLALEFETTQRARDQGSLPPLMEA